MCLYTMHSIQKHLYSSESLAHAIHNIIYTKLDIIRAELVVYGFGFFGFEHIRTILTHTAYTVITHVIIIIYLGWTSDQLAG